MTTNAKIIVAIAAILWIAAAAVSSPDCNYINMDVSTC